MKYHFDKCPRCNIDWKLLPAIKDFGLRDTKYCKCGLYLVSHSSVVVLPLTDGYPKTDDGGRLYWIRNSCRYTSDRKCVVDIKLPVLPFTITKEDLVKYLLLV